MGVEGFACAETGLKDASNNDGELSLGAGVTIVAGGMGGDGSYHYLSDMSTSGSNGLATIVAQLSGNTMQVAGLFEVHWVTPPYFDVPILTILANRFIKYGRLTDSKIHLYGADGTTEIDSANAFTITEDSEFGLILEMDVASPYQCRLYYSSTPATPGSWTLKQQGNAAEAPSVGAIKIGETLGKGVNHNWKLAFRNIWGADDTAGASLQHNDFWHMGIEGVPTGAGNYADYTDSGGTACSVPPSPACYTLVDEGVTPNTSDYLIAPAATPTIKYQSFATSSLLLSAGDTVGAVRVCSYDSRVAGGGAMSIWTLLRLSGTDELLPASPPSASFFKWGATQAHPTDPSGADWTVANAQAAEIGHVTQINTFTYYVSAMYKLVAYIPGVAGQRRRGRVIG